RVLIYSLYTNSLSVSYFPSLLYIFNEASCVFVVDPVNKSRRRSCRKAAVWLTLTDRRRQYLELMALLGCGQHRYDVSVVIE
ncbi:hypothetical protein, partial [Bacillus haynesii]|uniref:hypothetical protein n=1 Tax=Bacillus haynesii TaxID=1925021 RepID=UPI001F61C457